MARKRGTRVDRTDMDGPPPEQADAFRIEDIVDRIGQTQRRIGKAYRRRPMIDILRDADVIDSDQHKALRHYRHHADLADRSPVRDSLCPTRGGSNGPTITTLNALRVVRDCEAAAGSLAGLLRQVVVYDRSLSQVAIDRAGGLEECYERKGRTVCQIKPRRGALEIVRLEIQIAAQRVQAELDA